MKHVQRVVNARLMATFDSYLEPAYEFASFMEEASESFGSTPQRRALHLLAPVFLLQLFVYCRTLFVRGLEPVELTVSAGKQVV